MDKIKVITNHTLEDIYGFLALENPSWYDIAILARRFEYLKELSIRYEYDIIKEIIKTEEMEKLMEKLEWISKRDNIDYLNLFKKLLKEVADIDLG